jgi:hypothetical protein
MTLPNSLQVSNTFSLPMAYILLTKVTKKSLTSLRKALPRSCQKNRILLPSLFQVRNLAPVARNPATTIGEASCRQSAVLDQKTQTQHICQHIKAQEENGKGIQ